MPTSKVEIFRATLKATAVFSPIFLAQQVASTPHAESVIPAGVEFASQERVSAQPLVEVKTVQRTLTFTEASKTWDKLMEKKFEKLSILEATAQISAAQMEELEALTKERRRLHHPRSADEILFEYRQRQLTSNLVKALNEYVEFHDVAD